MQPLTLDKIYHAAFTMKGVVRTTDLIHAPDLLEGSEIYLKTENLQVTGSFKVRGAYYKISQLSPEERSHGVLACSAGNHAQGVALAATRAGLTSTICIPDGAPISKVEATKRYGARVELVKGVYDDAYARACELQKETGAALIHPFDDPAVIAGQGTIGLEILDQLPDVDAVIVPIGGGGLISGIEPLWPSPSNPLIHPSRSMGCRPPAHLRCSTPSSTTSASRFPPLRRWPTASRSRCRAN